MDSNGDFYGKELNLNCFHMHTIFGQKYPKRAIVIGKPEATQLDQKTFEVAFEFLYNVQRGWSSLR